MVKKRILLADDEEDIKTVVAMFLEAQGYEVITAFDGLDALEKVRTEKPDLILLDIMMPVLDGFEVCKRLKENEDTARIPIVILSAAAHVESVNRGLKAGAKDYIVKPFEPEKLVEKIEQFIGK
ncbi:MAG: response regulator [Candidatus Sumerlaeia bacterium]|nr:response regulator [Candidatus Sumerlaeia bacterium]